MEMKLELVLLPVADVDRARTFYVETLGFHADVDVRPAPGIGPSHVAAPSDPRHGRRPATDPPIPADASRSGTATEPSAA